MALFNPYYSQTANTNKATQKSVNYGSSYRPALGNTGGHSLTNVGNAANASRDIGEQVPYQAQSTPGSNFDRNPGAIGGFYNNRNRAKANSVGSVNPYSTQGAKQQSMNDASGERAYGAEDWSNYQKSLAQIAADKEKAMQSAYAQDALKNRATYSNSASGGYGLGGAGMMNMLGATQAGNMQNDQSVQNAYGAGGSMQQALFDDMEKRRQARERGEQQNTLDMAGVISYGS